MCDVYLGSDLILICKVAQVDKERSSVEVTVVEVLKGQPVGEKVMIQFVNQAPLFDRVKMGQAIVIMNVARAAVPQRARGGPLDGGRAARGSEAAKVERRRRQRGHAEDVSGRDGIAGRSAAASEAGEAKDGGEVGRWEVVSGRIRPGWDVAGEGSVTSFSRRCGWGQIG